MILSILSTEKEATELLNEKALSLLVPYLAEALSNKAQNLVIWYRKPRTYSYLIRILENTVPEIVNVNREISK